MNEKVIGEKLVARGQELFLAPRTRVEFTKNIEADNLLNDLAEHPHAFVLACVMDRQIKAEMAWMIPYEISKKIGGFSMEALCKLSPGDVAKLMSEPKSLHRYSKIMSGLFHSAVQRIASKYANNAAGIWDGNLASAEVVYRFLEFDGVGPKIASMAVNILARDFKIPFTDHYSIDISADVHIRRVFTRLGICAHDPKTEQIIYKARAIYPKFPGLLDLPCWDIGRNWCKARGPDCRACYMEKLCPTAQRME